MTVMEKCLPSLHLKSKKKFQLIMRGKKFSLLIFDMDTSVKIDFKSFVVRMNFQNMLDFNKLMGRQLYCIESPRI